MIGSLVLEFAVTEADDRLVNAALVKIGAEAGKKISRGKALEYLALYYLGCGPIAAVPLRATGPRQPFRVRIKPEVFPVILAAITETRKRGAKDDSHALCELARCYLAQEPAPAGSSKAGKAAANPGDETAQIGPTAGAPQLLEQTTAATTATTVENETGGGKEKGTTTIASRIRTVTGYSLLAARAGLIFRAPTGAVLRQTVDPIRTPIARPALFQRAAHSKEGEE